MLKSIASILLFSFLLCFKSYSQGLQIESLQDEVLVSTVNFANATAVPKIQIKKHYTKDHLKFYKFKAEDLPIFCKMEHRLAKKSNINFKFRLGSVDYVDKLESK